MEANDKRNKDVMDLTVPIKLGDGCPFLIKFYGAMHAEVKNFAKTFLITHIPNADYSYQI